MEVEKERLSSNFLLPKWLWLEHDSRFRFASNLLEGKTVIDCACGSGDGTNIFSKKAASIRAFDLAEEALQEARKKCTSPNVNFTLASATSLPLPNEFADVYISLETIEHIPQDKEFLDEVSRVLKKGGTFICSTPNRKVTNPGKTIFDKPANVFHIREYTEAEFTELLGRYFKNIEIHGQNPNSKLKVLFLNFIGKFAPFHLAVRIHQLIKLVAHIFRSNTYYEVQNKKPGCDFEYMTAVCVK
jgi:2-polyprenyl-3-methyl-5-hydroxy-6-metoxy-1,4-benzoquinol methylase